MAKAKLYKFKQSQHTMKELATHFKLSYCRMSNLMHKYKHDADAVYTQRNSTDGAKRSGKNPKTFAVDTAGMVRKTVEEIAQVTGYSKAAISGKIKRGITGLELLKKKNVKPLYLVEPKVTGSKVTRLPDTVRADKNRLRTTTLGPLRSTWDDEVIARANKNNTSFREKFAAVQSPIDHDEMMLRGVNDTSDKQQLKNAIDDYVAAGGTIQKLFADGTTNGNSWKDQAKQTYAAGPGRKKKRKLGTRTLPKTLVVDENGNRKGSSVDVTAFIAELEKERDQRKAYGEVLHLAGDMDIEELESLLPKTVG